MIAIDLAYPARIDENPREPLDLPYTQHPLGTDVLTENIKRMFLANVSEPLKQYLRKISAHDIIEMANNSNYVLSDKELKQMMDRIRFVSPR